MARTVGVRERIAVQLESPCPLDGEFRIRLCNRIRLLDSVAGKADRKTIIAVEHPGIASFRGEEDQRAERDETGIMLSSTIDDVPRLAAYRNLAPAQAE
jgi:hypothetical protein